MRNDEMQRTERRRSEREARRTSVRVIVSV
jgi:hypothetical protein